MHDWRWWSAAMNRHGGRGVMICGALIVLFVLSSAPTTLSAKGNDSATQKILSSANAHYKAGRFAKATGMYVTAHELSGNSAFLFNAGRSEQRAFRLDSAEKHFRAYLAAEKSNEGGIAKAKLHLKEISEARAALKREGKAAAATAKLAAVKAEAARKKAQQAREATVSAAQSKPAPSRIDGVGSRAMVGIGLLVVGVGSAGAGAFMLSNAGGEQSALEKQIEGKTRADGLVNMPYAGYKTEQRKINDKVVLGDTLIGAGVVVAAVGAWLAWTNPTVTSVAFDPRSDYFNLQVTVEF